jgi:hypothetical protein
MFISPEIIESKEIPSGVKLLLYVLLKHTDKRGQSFPGLTKIAQEMSKSRRSVSTYIKQAVELKLIKVKYRWLTTNEYTLLCLVPPKVVNRVETVAEKLNPLKSKTTLPLRERLNSREVKVCLEDSKDLLGENVFNRNKGWLYKLICSAGYDLFQECLHWLRNAMLMGECDGRPINAPCGMLTYHIRKFVEV